MLDIQYDFGHKWPQRFYKIFAINSYILFYARHITQKKLFISNSDQPLFVDLLDSSFIVALLLYCISFKITTQAALQVSLEHIHTRAHALDRANSTTNFENFPHHGRGTSLTYRVLSNMCSGFQNI